MMSDEEKVGETYVRHQPSFRSERLNKFINKLDERLEKTASTHPRHLRVLGSPVQMSRPEHAKSWMFVDPPLIPDEDNANEDGSGIEDIISEGSDNEDAESVTY